MDGSATLLAGAILDLATAALYFHVGGLVKRSLPDSPGRAREAFGLFWSGIAVVNLLQALLSFAALAGAVPLPLAVATWQTRIALALASFAGLVYYMVFLYTGRRRVIWPISAYYLVTFFLMMLWIQASVPHEVRAEAWRVDLGFAQETRTPLYASVVLLFFLPPVAAAGAYAWAVRHVGQARQRRRGRLLATSLAAYFVGLTLGYLTLGWWWWGLVENALGLATGALALLALHSSPLADHPLVAGKQRLDALYRRVKEII